MKKFWKIIRVLSVSVLIIFLIGLIGGFIFLKNFDIEKFKPQIITMASQSLGRPVDFKNIDLKVSLAEGARIHLSGVSIGEDPAFGSESFMSAGEIEVGFDILAFLSTRHISIPNIVIRSPRITIVRNAKGVLNAQTLAQPSSGASPQGQAAAAKTNAPALPVILINSFKITNAEVHFIDQSGTPEQKISITQLNVEVRKFSLTDPFDVSLDGAVLSAQTDLRVNGKMQLVLAGNEAKLIGVDILADLNQFSLDQLKGLPMLKGVPIPQVLHGQLKVLIREAAVSDKGLGALVMDASLNGGEIVAADIVPGISFEAKRLDCSIAGFSLKGAATFQMLLTGALYQDETNVNFKSDVSFDPRTMDIRLADGHFATDLASWPLEKMKSAIAPLKTVPLPEQLTGKLQATVKDLDVSPSGLKNLLLDIKLSGGGMTLNNVIPNASVALNKMEIEVKDFSLDKPFSVSLKAAYLSDEPDVSFDGTVSSDAKSQAVEMKNAVVGLDLDRFSLDRLKASGLVPKSVPVPEILGGKLEARINDVIVSPQGVAQLRFDMGWQDGRVSIKELTPGVSFAASHIDAQIKDFGLGTSFAFNVGLAYLHDKPNIQVRGTATVRMGDQSVCLKDTTFETDLGTFALEDFKSSVTALKNVSLPETLQGKLTIAIADAVAGSKGLSRLTSDGSLKDGEVKLKEFAVPIKGVDTTFKLTEKDFSMDAIQASIGKGHITAQGGVTDYLSSRNFTVTTELKGIDLSEVLDQKQAQIKVEGQVYGNFTARGQGADINSITGSGNVEVRTAKLKDFNALKAVLDKISFIPGASSLAESGLPEKYKAQLQSKDTDINKITTAVAISNGMAVLDPVSIEADDFNFSGKSRAGFDQKYTVDGTVKIPAELSAAMVKGVSQMQYLFDENQNISLPVHVSGQGAQSPAVAVTQTAIDMSKNALRNEGKQQLGKVLDKILGGGKNSSPADSQNQQPGETPQAQSSPAGKIIDGIFGKILK